MAFLFQRPDYDEFFDELSSTQLQMWLDYFDLEPAGFRLFDTHFSQLNTSVINSTCNFKQTFKKADFSLAHRPEKSVDDLIASIEKM
ncbi:phage tail assembly protein T [Pseudoalteromonas umbrosa]|uniref:phage tail assembly protein T n=1 Tax=Pseudoalteromonas umbrosa TaxID=3048489 RepID=UPI0024C22986|nr:phage tail assembly protein T [Pseudoalteromonas sp. B95]MDK1289779.1 phage tail assembly protein T [Pseudoalteromonas sp. B95]